MNFLTTPLKTVTAAVGGILMAFASHAAIAAPVYSADTLIKVIDLTDSGQTELAMLRSYTGNALLTPVKVETDIIATADDGQWYIDAGTATPGYFVLKFGVGSTNQPSHYFFKNDGAIGATKLVWTNEQVNFLTGGGNCYIPDAVPKKNDKAPDLTSCSIGRLSHYSFGGDMDVPATDTDVPEPGSLALAGLSLLGLLGARRKIAK